jgi:group I intron endonuclease
MYIYKFTLIDTNRSYIGQTIQNPNQRRLEHIADSRHPSHTYHFHNALRKYGVNNFTFEVIATASTLEQLNSLEEQFIEQYDSIDNGFNIRNGGDNRTHNIESIERMKLAQLSAHARRRAEGKDGGWTRKDGGPMKGKVHSDETKQKMSIAHQGRKLSPERIEKMIGVGKGRIVSEETKQKLRLRSLESWAKRKQAKDQL